MKKRSVLKRIGMGFVGLTMASVMFVTGSLQGVQEVHAERKVFDRITQRFPASTTGDTVMKILEITPAVTDPVEMDFSGQKFNVMPYSELGYYMCIDRARSEASPSPIVASLGLAVTSAKSGAMTNFNDNVATHADAAWILYQLRNYGLIAPFGMDSAFAYPIYAEGISLFSQFSTASATKPLEGEGLEPFVKGIYYLEAGDYQLLDGYTLDNDHQICKINEQTVSGNDISEDGTRTVSENALEPGSRYTQNEDGTFTYKQLEKVPNSELDGYYGLPKGRDGTEYIKKVEKGTGNLRFVQPEVAPEANIVLYYGLSETTVYFTTDNNVKFKNSDYFRECVLGGRDAYKNSKIQYDVVAANKVTEKMVEEADLIYISSSTQVNEYNNYAQAIHNDISDAVMKKIYDLEVNEHKAVIMDYKIYKGDLTDKSESGERSNVWKLALLLWQESQNTYINNPEYASNFELETADGDVSKIRLATADLSDELIEALQSTRLEGYNGNFVTGNVYVYNHHMSDYKASKALQDTTDIIANGDFDSAYNEAAVSAGFAPVLADINATNTSSTNGNMGTDVTPAVAIQYILISDGNPLSVLKNELSVLEIEPVCDFLYNPTDVKNEEYGYLDKTYKDNRDYFIKNYLGKYYEDKKEYISFTSMSVDEFNGRNEDLIENFDVIYIGSNIGKQFYTTSVETKAPLNKADGAYYMSDNSKKTNVKLPYYTILKIADNDGANAAVNKNMTGNVYYSQGSGFEMREDRLYNYMTKQTTRTRYGARDITKDKLTKLKDFVDDGHLVLCSEDLMTSVLVTGGSTAVKINPTAIQDPLVDGKKKTYSDTTDKGRMDNSCNMYEFFQYARGNVFDYDKGEYTNSLDGGLTTVSDGPKENVISVKDIEYGLVNRTLVDRFIMKQKMGLTMTQTPAPYDYKTKADGKVIDNGTIQYLEQESNGDRFLTFGFVINSEISNSTGNSSYRPHLYIDINNDGKFSKTTEDILDITIIEKSSENEAPRDPSDNNRYALSKDVEYIMRREVDKSYSGYLSWKVSVDSNEYSNVHASVQGSTVAKNITGKDEAVKILQINNNGSTTLNLENQNKSNTSLYGKYLADVAGYDVYIDTIEMQQFEDDFEKKFTEAQRRDRTLTPEKYAMEYFNQYTVAKDVVGANMLVLGFADDYAPFKKDNSLRAIKAFIDQGNPVLLTHDFIMFGSQTKQAQLLRETVGMDKYGVTDNIKLVDGQYTTVNKLVDTTGLDYLRTATQYTRSADLAVFKAIEGCGKSVPYEPGSGRNMISEYKQGLSNLIICRYRGTNWNSRNLQNFINTNKLNTGQGANNDDTYNISKLNDGQITNFPYVLPEKFMVSKTHTQYFELDMDADDDNDGESDTVVWYTFADNAGTQSYDPFRHDEAGVKPADAFFIYNKGNVTYTGAGHSNLLSPGNEYEAQLFVNTLFAAYKSKYVSPRTKFYETPDLNAAAISNLPIPYDGNVTKPEAGAAGVDSSILREADDSAYRYKFVDPNANAATEPDGTKMYFRLNDTNFVRGSKTMSVKAYLQTSNMDKMVTWEEVKEGSVTKQKLKLTTGGGDPIGYTLSDGTTRSLQSLTVENKEFPVVDITDKINLYSTTTGGAFDAALSRSASNVYEGLLSGVTYGFYLPMFYMNDNASYTIYFEVKSKIYTVSAITGQTVVEEVPVPGYDSLTVTKASLLKLN
ncbi:MAG: DUF5057 domain-containing protein [Lachnospiraceae bacterium]|nr:DUF5057 domain-containing protein [Lachnospiraceae bacterium]